MLLWKASLVDDDGAKQASLLQAEEEAKADEPAAENEDSAEGDV